MVGVAVVDPQTRKLVSSREWDISKYDSLYEKAELIGAELYALRSEYNIEDAFIETALKMFMPGKSRADTIIKLAKFNGIVSWLVYDCFDMRPVFINVNKARSLYGLSFPRGTKGPQRKKMVIEAVIEKKKHPSSTKWLVEERTLKEGLTTGLMQSS